MTQLTVLDVSRRLRLHEETVRSLIRLGDLPAVNVSAGSARPRWRISEADLEAFMARRAGVQSATDSDEASHE